ncbi:MAG: isoleucine--tRNA ligase [archaeon]
MYNFKETEQEVLDFWSKSQIYKKVKEKNAQGKKFYFMDGPPYATGHIHMGTALNKILKDIAMRTKRMQGYDVFDRAGYDTHGLPIEFQIEKEIGSKTKKDIEVFGVKKFIEKCKQFATQYIDVMNSEFKDLGVWMDFDNPYLTLSTDYIEAIWETFKVADEKGLLYLGKYPVHVCPRCETALAYNEIEYGKQDDTSVFVKFPLKQKKNTFLIIWTTTPWTLPGNTGVMVHPDFKYQKIELSNGDRWIIAKELVAKIMASLELGFNAKAEYDGKEMEGWEYENPLSKDLNLSVKNGYKIVLSGRYVHLEEGTGLVHCAPGHGKEDYEVGKEYELDMPSPVSINGLLTEEAGKYQGKKARVVDEEIITDLESKSMLVYKMKYNHDYPLCWRCKSPLLMISQPQWFLRISKIHDIIMSENEKTEWIPSWMKLRMNSWLEGVSDWPVSRKRYWGTPLPIWTCSKCNEKKVIGSVEELEELSGKKVEEVHKPEIDDITIKCECGNEMKRVEEVLDVWFDSGVSSWAALGFPKEKELFEKFWPADLNIEGKDQIRGWWNSQLILSVIRFGKKPFENIAVHGMVLDLGKKKMSKSMGNIISPQEIIQKFGRDYLRYYFAKVSKGEDFAFDEKEFMDIQKVITILLNVNNFIEQTENKSGQLNVEDEWILSRYHSALKEASEYYNKFRIPEALQIIERFIVFDLSRTYIQMIRGRASEAYSVLDEIRKGLLQILAPIMPFITEKIWQELKKKGEAEEESIHLCIMPEFDMSKINEKLENEFLIAEKIIEIGMAQRAVVSLGVRWPLAKAEVTCNTILSDEVEEIILKQLNVKEVNITKGEEISVKLDTKLTPKLEGEGYARELLRNIQDARKKSKLKKDDSIDLVLQLGSELKRGVEDNIDMIKTKVNATNITIIDIDDETPKKASRFDAEIKGKKAAILF